jgi:hypothetical protein
LQSAVVLHSTQVPAMFELLVSPHTCAWGSLARVQAVPVVASVKLGASGLPEQAGLVRQALLDVGRSVGSLTDVVLPFPAHTTFWQSPGVCSEGGATLLPG